jgi:hypothetical protein
MELKKNCNEQFQKEIYLIKMVFKNNIEAYTITMNQRNYMDKVFKDFNMEDANQSKFCSMQIQNC